jgi:Tfp pilus assembly protein PilF
MTLTARPRRAGWPLVVAWCLVVLGAGSARPDDPASPAGEAVRPVILVGLDGADWLTIAPLAAAGQLPSFARLQAVGRTGVLVATPPLLSPILWTTIATGRRPEDHRVLDFMVDVPSGGQAPVGVAQRRVEALWNIVSARGRRVAVVGWWATAPAEAVAGVVVSDEVAPQLLGGTGALPAGAISPASEAARLAPRIVRARDLRPADLAPYLDLAPGEWERARAALDAPAGRLYRDPVAHLMAVVAATRTYSAMAEDILVSTRPDLLLVYLEGIDSLSHRFVRDRRRGTGVIARAYRDADDLLARLAARADPRTWIVVCSDHGFHSATAALREDPAELTGPAAAWHRPYGIVAAVEASALAGGRRPLPPTSAQDAGTVEPLDVTPTILQALGLPSSLEMPGRVVSALLPPEAASRTFARVRSFEPATRPAAAASLAPDPETLERLRALGYVGAGTTSLARLNLGEIFYRSGKLAEAERELRAVVTAQPGNVPALLWLAKAVRDQGRKATALEIYEEALAQAGDNGDALLEAVDLAVEEGRPARARALAEGAAARRASVPAAAVARAIVARAQGRDDAALGELRRALAAEPTFLPALTRLLDLQVARGRAADARAALDRAAAVAPDSAPHLALAGEVALADRDPAAALPRFERALRLAPGADPVRLDLGRAQLALGRVEAALATLEAAAPSAERSVLQGAAHARRGEWSEAALSYRAALERGPASPEVLNGLAWARLQQGERAAAAGLLARSLALKPDQPEISRLLARIRAGSSR